MTRTREEWMNRLVNEFRSDFKRLGKPLPDRIRCSVGFPFGKRVTGPGSTVGQCWAVTAARDKKPQVFVSPVEADAFEVAHIIVHELVHAAGIGGHGKDFAEIARGLGLTGKMTSSEPGPELSVRLKAVIKKLGRYDHAVLDPSKKGAPPKQGTRLIKVMCPDPGCGYPARVTRTWLDNKGFPSCPCGEIMREESGE